MFNPKSHLSSLLVCIALIIPQSLSAGGDINVFDGQVGSEVNYPQAKIRSASIEVGQVTFVAMSNGCSLADDFTLEIEASVLNIKRIRSDRCRKKPQWKRFALPLNYAGDAESLTLGNSISNKPVRQTR